MVKLTRVCRVASLRVAYLLLCLKSPQKYYAMPEDDSIHLLNIAANRFVRRVRRRY